VGADFYRRTISLDGVHGVVEVRPVKEQHYLVATIRFPKIALLAQIVERLRRVFDLDANVADIMSHLQQNSVLSPAIAALPGLRVPGVWDSFELAVRAILGQQISVAAATTLAGRLVEAYGERLVIEGMSPKESELRFVFPRPEVLVDADLTALGITRPRALAIASLAAVVVRDRHILTNFQNLDDAVQKLSKFPGIGEWTAQYIAMRALREPDAFPATDLGLLRAMENLGHPVTRSELLKLSQAWRPWRAYAAMFLWSSLDSTPILIKEKLLA
jgi:AraC family transcriptional regulator of adaptative response / DNA-3-methyladenine glycosylase II